MAGRYSKEYRPNEFVKLPFEEVAKVMAMKEQQYQQGYLAHSAYQQEMGKQEDRAIDVDYSNFLMNNAKTKVENLVADTYGGDYGAGASDILRTLSNEANNPYYKMRKKLVEGEKLERDLEMKLNAEGKALAFKKDYTNKAYWDNTNNRANTEFVSDIQGKLGHVEKMNEIANDFALKVQGGNEQSFASAMKGQQQSANGRTWYDQKDTHYSGTALADEKHGKQKAYDTFKGTKEYTQMKKMLTDKGYAGDNALQDNVAEAQIKKTFDGIMESKLRLDYDVSSKPISEGIQKGYDANGKKITTEPIYFPETSNTSYTYKDNKFDEKYNNFKSTIFKNVLPYQTISKYNKELETVKMNIYKVKATDDPKLTEGMVKRKQYLENEIKKEQEKLSKTTVASLPKEAKLKIINDPSFKGMRGLVKYMVDSGLTLDKFDEVAYDATSSIRNNATTLSKQFKMSLNSPQEYDSVYKNILNSQKETFVASDLGGGDRYDKDTMLGILASNPKATSEVRGDGSIIVHTSVKIKGDKYVAKDIVIPSSSFSNEKRPQLRGIWTVLDSYNQFGNAKSIGNVTGDANQVSTIPIEDEGQVYYPAVTPLDRNVKLYIKTKNGYVDSGKRKDLGEVVSSYYAGFIGTTTQYNNTTNIYN